MTVRPGTSTLGARSAATPARCRYGAGPAPPRPSSADRAQADEDAPALNPPPPPLALPPTRPATVGAFDQQAFRSHARGPAGARAQVFQWALLNLVALHFRFGHMQLALEVTIPTIF